MKLVFFETHLEQAAVGENPRCREVSLLAGEKLKELPPALLWQDIFTRKASVVIPGDKQMRDSFDASSSTVCGDIKRPCGQGGQQETLEARSRGAVQVYSSCIQGLDPCSVFYMPVQCWSCSFGEGVCEMLLIVFSIWVSF